MRRTPQLESALPILYLRGLFTGDFSPVIAALLGEEVSTGFSASTDGPSYGEHERIVRRPKEAVCNEQRENPTEH